MTNLSIYSAVLRRNFIEKNFNIKQRIDNDIIFMLDMLYPANEAGYIDHYRKIFTIYENKT